MKNKFSGVLLVFGSVFIAVIIVFRLFANGGEVATPSQEHPIVSLPEKVTPMPEYDVEVSFDTTDVIPPTLPTYEIERLSTELIGDFMLNLTKSLQIQATPSTLIRNDITIKSWLRTGEVELTHTKSMSGDSVLYRRMRANSRPTGKISQDTIVADFISLFRPASSGLVLVPVSSSSASLTGLLVLDTPSPSSFVTRVFAHMLSGYQLVDSSHNPLALSVMIDNFGIIRFSNYFIPPVIRSQLNSVVLINHDGIKKNILSGRAGVISSANKVAPEWGERPSFTSLVIKKIQVVYAQKENLLLPGYILSCDGKNGAGAQQSVSLFMWAAPEIRGI
jgi:hypothetical protein